MAGPEDSTGSSGSEVATTNQAAVVVSPYLLSSNDNPGTSISSVTLNGENYNEWSEEMLNALQAK